MHQLMKKHLVLAALITTSSCLVSYSLCAANAAEPTSRQAGTTITHVADSSPQVANDAVSFAAQQDVEAVAHPVEGGQYTKKAMKLKTP